MPESRNTRLARWEFNFYPCYRGSGARVTCIASDWREIHVELAQQPSIDRVYSIDLKDAEGNVRATVEKTIYVAHRK